MTLAPLAPLAPLVAAALPPEAEPLRASLAPLMTGALGGMPWREALMMASPVVGTIAVRRRRR